MMDFSNAANITIQLDDVPNSFDSLLSIIVPDTDAGTWTIKRLVTKSQADTIRTLTKAQILAYLSRKSATWTAT